MFTFPFVCGIFLIHHRVWGRRRVKRRRREGTAEEAGAAQGRRGPAGVSAGAQGARMAGRTEAGPERPGWASARWSDA